MLYKFADVVDNVEIARLYLYTIDLPSRYLGVIEDVYTKEEFRMQGRATRLMKQALEKGKDLGLDVIELTVREDRPYICEFYKSLGFYDRNNRSMRFAINDKWKYIANS